MSAVASGTRYAVVDVETTGLSPASDRILQLAIVRVSEDGEIHDSWSRYVRPPHLLTANLGPVHIHGINRRDLITGASEKRALSTLARLTADHVVVAHNAKFDVAFLRHAADRHHVSLHWSGTACTLDLSRRLDPERRLLHRLPDVCERYGVSIGQAHHALHDARATAAVLTHLLRAHGFPDLTDSGQELSVK